MLSSKPCQVCSRWELPTIAMDAGIIRKNPDSGESEILLITRGRDPFKVSCDCQEWKED